MPISGYMAFFKSEQQGLFAKGMKLQEIGKAIGEKWHTLSREDQDAWRSKGVELENIRQEKIASGEIKPKLKRSKRNSEGAATKIRRTTSRPKGLTSPYFVFLKEKRPSIVAEHKTLASTEVVKLVAQEWGKLSTELRQHYQQLANEINEKIKQAASGHAPIDAPEDDAAGAVPPAPTNGVPLSRATPAHDMEPLASTSQRLALTIQTGADGTRLQIKVGLPSLRCHCGLALLTIEPLSCCTRCTGTCG